MSGYSEWGVQEEWREALRSVGEQSGEASSWSWGKGSLTGVEVREGGKTLSKRLANFCQGPENKQFRLHKPRDTTKELVCLCLNHVTTNSL